MRACARGRRATYSVHRDSDVRGIASDQRVAADFRAHGRALLTTRQLQCATSPRFDRAPCVHEFLMVTRRARGVTAFGVTVRPARRSRERARPKTRCAASLKDALRSLPGAREAPQASRPSARENSSAACPEPKRPKKSWMTRSRSANETGPNETRRTRPPAVSTAEKIARRRHRSYARATSQHSRSRSRASDPPCP
jgi:hypothetical protein